MKGKKNVPKCKTLGDHEVDIVNGKTVCLKCGKTTQEIMEPFIPTVIIKRKKRNTG